MKDNIDVFYGDKVKLHIGIVGYDFGETGAYWIGNKNIRLYVKYSG